jgi:predicted MPP superfamily phosphohydrolase
VILFKGIGIIGAFFVALIGIMYRNAFTNKISETHIKDKHFPKSAPKKSLFFISDIHKRIIHPSLINEARGRVSAVVIGGDLLESGVSLKNVKRNLVLLKELGEVYFVWGNNDYEIDENQLIALFEEEGIKQLRNEKMEWGNGSGIYLAGVDDLNMKKDRLSQVLLKKENEIFSLLISHDPRMVHKLPKNHPFSLLLSGHTHGGQIRLFGFGLHEKGKWYNTEGFFQLISNGYGTTKLPLRLGAPAECHIITISSME